MAQIQKNLGKLHPHIEGDKDYGFKYASFITSNTVFAASAGLSGAAVAGQLRYDTSEATYKYWNGSAEVALAAASALGVGLDGAYDQGKTITVDAATITLTGSNVDVLTATQSANDDIIVLNKTGAGAGNVIDITNAGTGKDIDGHGSAWSVTSAGAATFTTIAGTDLTFTGTQTITTDDTSGVAINIEADSLTTGTAIEVDSNTGANVTLLDLQNAGTSCFIVSGTGILTLAGVAKDADAIAITAGDITLTAGDIDMSSGQFTLVSDQAGIGMAVTDTTGGGNYDLVHFDGSTSTGSGNILAIDQGASIRTGHMIDLDMGTTSVGMSAIDISCTGGTRTKPIIAIDSDGTAEDFIDMVTSVIFTGNMLSMTADTGAATGNFIYINNDSGTSMEAINIDDEVNTQDIVKIDTAAATADNKALINLIWSGTPAAAGSNMLRVDGSGGTNTVKPVLVEILDDSVAVGLSVTTASIEDMVTFIGTGATGSAKAVVDITSTALLDAAGNLLRVDLTGADTTSVPTAIEVVGTGETARGLYIDTDGTSVGAAAFHSGGVLTNGVGVVNITNDGNLAAGGNLLNVTMGGTPADQTVSAVEVLAAKNCMALDIASSAVASNCVRIIGSGALTNGLAVLSVSSAAALAAGGNLLNLTYTGTPADATVSAVDLVVSQDCLALDVVTSAATTDAVRITGVGSIADDMALLQIAHGTGTVASGGSLVKLTGATAATAGAYGMTIDCSGANFEALWVEAGKVKFAETLEVTGVITATAQIDASAAGVKGILGTAADLTDTTPTDAEFSTAFGVGNKTVGGFTGVVEDSGSGVTYLVVSDGTTWHFALLTAAG